MTSSCGNTGATRSLNKLVNETSRNGILSHHGQEATKSARWSGLSRWGLSWTYTRFTRWQACIGEHLRKYPEAQLIHHLYCIRYLQYLANVRLQELIHSQHCNLIRYEELPKHARMKRVSLQNNLQFTEFNILEVSAIQNFADGLSCVSHLIRA